jgi:uncharacterized protein YukE
MTPPLPPGGAHGSGQQSYPNLGFNPAPGSKDAVRKLHDKLVKCADLLDETQETVTKLAVGSYWKGDAAVAFRDQLQDGPLPRNLRNAARSLRKAARQLDRWEGDLDDFQRRARRLEEKAHDARIAVQQAQRRSDKAADDPDIEKKGARGDDAQLTLDRFQRDVLNADQDLARILDEARRLAVDHEDQARLRAGLIEDADEDFIPFAPTEEDYLESLGWIHEGNATATGPGAGAGATGPAYGKEGMLKAYADLFHLTADGSLTRGWLRLSGIADIYSGARSTASFGANESGISANAEASVGTRALVEGRAGTEHFGIYHRATGFHGGEAGINAGVSLTGVRASAKAFAGAKGGIAKGTEIGGISAGGTVEGWAGPGAEASMSFGKDEDGKFRFKAKAGASPLVGGALGMEITVDPGAVADTAKGAAGKLGDGVGKVGDGVGSVKDGITGLF